MENKSSLPDPWVAKIFDKLALTYGAAWVRKWEGVDGEKVRGDWGHELRGFQQSPNAIKHALEHLPPAEPPTVLQFRELCMKAPQFAPKALPAPTPDPKVVTAVLGAIKQPPTRPAKFWAHALQAREQAGEKLTITQKTIWREALRVQSSESEAA